MNWQHQRRARFETSGSIDDRTDTFDDVDQDLEGTLAGTDAASNALGLQEQIRPEGLCLMTTCNCGRPINLVISWAELLCIANNISPASQGMNLDPNWAAPFPRVHVPTNACTKCSQPLQVQVTSDEAARALNKGVSLGFAARDPKYAAVANIIQQALQAQQGQPMPMPGRGGWGRGR